MTSSHVNKSIQRIWQKGPIDKHVSATRFRKATSTAVRAAVPEAREALAKHMTHSTTTADRHYALFNQRQIAMPVANLISSVMEKSCPGRVNTSIHWPGRKNILAIENTSAQNKEDSQEQTASLLNKEDKVQADSQVKNLLAQSLANIPTSKDGDHTQTVDDPTFGDKAQTAEGLHEVEKKKESSNEPISDSDNNGTIEYDEMYERPQSPLYSNDIIESETRSHKRRTFTPQEAERLLVLCHQNIEDDNLCKKAVAKTLESTEEGQFFVETIKTKDLTKGKDVWKIICDRLRTHVRQKKK